MAARPKRDAAAEAPRAAQHIEASKALVGASSSLTLVWSIADVLNALMAVPNLIALLVLSPVIVKLSKEYFNRETP